MCAAHQRQNGQGEVIQFKEITRDFSWKRLLYQMVNSQRFSSRSSVEFPFHSTWLHSVILFWRVFFVVIFEKNFFHKVTALQQCHLICNICSILMNRTNPYSSPLWKCSVNAHGSCQIKCCFGLSRTACDVMLWIQCRRVPNFQRRVLQKAQSSLFLTWTQTWKLEIREVDIFEMFVFSFRAEIALSQTC